jgi:hypothetical protein
VRKIAARGPGEFLLLNQQMGDKIFMKLDGVNSETREDAGLSPRVEGS